MIFRVPACRQLIYNAQMVDPLSILQLLALILFLPGLYHFLAPGREGPVPILWQGIPTVALVVWCVIAATGGWRQDVGFTLWISAGAVLLLHLILALRSETMRRLGGLVLGYGFIVGLLSVLSGLAGEHRMDLQGGWIAIHIVISLLAYGLITLASVAALSVVLKEGALKSRRMTRLSAALPPVVTGEAVQFRLLALGEAVLAAGLVTGISVQVTRDMPIFALDHKTILLAGTFLMIAALLIIQHAFGYRGRRASRIVLASCLLITLAYPGVKFITDILITAVSTVHLALN